MTTLAFVPVFKISDYNQHVRLCITSGETVRWLVIHRVRNLMLNHGSWATILPIIEDEIRGPHPWTGVIISMLKPQREEIEYAIHPETTNSIN